MTGNKAYLADYQEFKGGSVAFGGRNRKITGKGKIKTGSKELASPKQTALGKDISNLLMAVYTYYCLLKVNAASLKLTTARVSAAETNAEIFDGLAKMGYKKLSEKLTFYKAFFSPQWKFLIHTILQCLSAKTTSWNEFSSTMASAIICLATNKKFNFSRYILLSLVKNIEAGVPFFMFSRGLVLVSLGVVTPLFDNMLVPAAKEVGLIQDDVQSIFIPTKPSTSKPHKKHKPKKQQTQAHKVPSPEPSPKHRLPLPYNDPLPGESEVIDIKSTYKERIEKLKGRVNRLEEGNRVLKELHSVHSKVDTAAPVVEKEKSFKQGRIIADIDEDVSVPRRRRGVVIQDPEETTSTVVVHLEVQSKDKGKDINWNDIIEQVKKSERLNDAVMKYQALKRKPLTKAQARKNMIIYLKNMAGYKMNYFKGMTYNKIRPLFEKHYNYNQAFLEEVNEEVTVTEKEVEVEGHKREGKSLEKEITNKQKMDEEAEELKSHLQIVSNDDDDDVYTEATPLASKISIVDYKIHLERNQHYFKIIRAVEATPLASKISIVDYNIRLERNKPYFKIIRADERFEKTEPNNYTDDYLLKTLKTMFKRPDVEASVWRDQKGRYVLAKRYPLTHFTLEQMLNNVRLEAGEESKMSLELLRPMVDATRVARVYAVDHECT
uniref:Glutamic acid-rich protein-like n=1 Tax=Tanacetum cinerariifolium TaxID=118510 RepID=A0A699HJ44_TANCI|nr:hypothetical protein [Tanacetum cinerariifolium]